MVRWERTLLLLSMVGKAVMLSGFAHPTRCNYQQSL